MKAYQKLIINAKYCQYQSSPDDISTHIKYSDISDYKLWSDCLELIFHWKRAYQTDYLLHKGALSSKRKMTYQEVPSLRIPHPEGMHLYRFLQKKNGKSEEATTKPIDQLSLFNLGV